MNDEGVKYPDPERPTKRNHSQQLMIDNISTYDVENPNRTNKKNIYYSLVFLENQKGRRKGTSDTNNLQYIDLHILKKVEKGGKILP